MKKRKQAQSDFTFEQLPHNRKEVFFDCIRLHWKMLLCLGLISLLFALPVIACEAFTDIVWSSIYVRLTNGEITQDAATAYLSSLRVFSAMLSVVGWLIFSVGLAGIARVIRQLAWGEPIFFVSDFVQGIRQNVGKYLAVFGICAVVKFASTFFTEWFAETSLLAYIPFVLLACFFMPIGLWILSQVAVYQVSFGKACTNAMAFFGDGIWQTTIFTLLACAPSLLSLASAVVKYVTIVVAIVVTLPLYCLCWFLFCSATFDRYINSGSFAELYDKGVYRLDSPVK